MNLLSLSEITEKAQNAFKRFPITLIWAILGTFFCMFLLEDTDTDRFEENIDTVLTLVLGISWFIGIQFLIEQLKAPKKWKGLKIVVFGLLVAFFWYLPADGSKINDNPEFLIRFALYFFAGHLFVLFAPFLLKWDKRAYWNYLKSLTIAIGRSVFFSGVLCLGLVLALVSIDALFEANIRGERYGQLFIFCLGIVNTWIYLSDFPENILYNTNINFERALDVFVKYILIPLVLLYVVILYAYGFKILFDWELPKGWVSYLVTALALLGFVVHVIIDPVQKSSKAWTIQRFYPWFYVVLLPLVVLLFVAIFRRVADYGITENRYFVLIIAFWILGISLYLLMSKEKRLIVLPISLLVLALLTSFGFWGVFEISKNSQIRQFRKVFETVESNYKKATSEQFDQLKSILDYMHERESLPELDAITGIHLQNSFNDTLVEKWETQGWFDTTKVLDSLGITVSQEELDKKNPNGTFYSYYTDQYKIRNYNIGQFSYFSPIQFDSHNKNKREIGAFKVTFDSENVSLSLLANNDSSPALEIPLKKKLIALTRFGTDLYKVNEREMVLESENDSILVQLILTDINYNVKQDSVMVNNASALMFLKQK